MKRILILICVFVFCLCGCQNQQKNIDASEQIIVFPTEQIAASVNGYKNAPNENADNNSMEYIGNKGSKKFHLSDCRYAENIKTENIIKSFDRNKMINDGYAPCQSCNP